MTPEEKERLMGETVHARGADLTGVELPYGEIARAASILKVELKDLCDFMITKGFEHMVDKAGMLRKAADE